MISFIDMFPGIGGFRAGLKEMDITFAYRQKAAHEAAVAATEAREAAV